MSVNSDEIIRLLRYMPKAHESAAADLIESLISERDALRGQVEYKEKEIKYAFESLDLIRNQAQDYEEEIRRLMKDNQALREEIRKAQEQEPVAWAHQKRNRDVIHNDVKDLVKKSFEHHGFHTGVSRCDVDRSENYTIPLYASPVPAHTWMPIESAPDNEWVLVTGNNMIGDPPEGRFYMRAKKENDEFISTDGFGEIYNPGYLTHWTHEPKSDENKIIERLPY